MAGIKIVDLPAVGRDLAATDLFEMSLVGGTGSRKITGQEIMNASKLNVGSTPVINGSGGGVFFQGTGNVLQQSSNFTWDNPNQTLYIGGLASFGGNTDQIRASSNSGNFDFLSNLPIRFLQRTGSVERMRIVSSTGNVLINTTTDAGFRLDVNGTARVNAQLEVNSVNSTQGILLKHFALATTATQIYYNSPDAVTYFDTLYNYAASTGLGSYNFRTKNSGNVLTSRLFIQGWDGSIGIGTTTPAATLDVNGTARVQGTITGLVPNGVASLNLTNAAADSTFTNVISSTWSRTSFSSQGVTGVFWANPQSTPQSGFASGVGYGANGAGVNVNIGNFNTSNAGGGINYYAQQNGISFGHRWFQGGTEIMRIPTSGNLLINTTTDSGFKLDVNGTARVQSRLTVGTASVAAEIYGNPSVAMNFGGGQTTDVFTFTQINSGRFQAAGTTEQSFMRLSIGQAESSGQQNIGSVIRMLGTLTNSTGTSFYNNIQNNTVVNTSGGTTIYRGFYHNPTLTATVGVTHYAFHSTSGRVRLEGLPTSPTGLSAGDLYNDGGTIKIV